MTVSLARGRVENDQLGGGVVLEQGIVVSRLEQVTRLVRGAGRRPRSFDDFRTGRNGRRLGSRSTLRDAADEQALLVR